MAEIISGESRKRKIAGVAKSTKLSTRVDLTPMVDLGFLLITFFIFTTSMSQPKALTLILPNDTGSGTPTKESGALTLLPGNNNAVFYYEGIFDANHIKEAGISSIRDVIIDKKRRTNAKDLVVIIKPLSNSNYGNMVNILDEMTINDIKRYAIVDMSKEELKAFK